MPEDGIQSLGGPAYTDSYVRTSGARGFSIECTEAMMHENLQDRIPRYISEKAAAVAHKTGTGDMTPDGRIMAINDIGTNEWVQRG